MRILSWNIRHGGGRRCREIAEAIRCFDADLVALQEFRASSAEIGAELEQCGYSQSFGPEVETGANGIRVLSRIECSPVETRRTNLVAHHKWQEFICQDWKCLAVHVPNFCEKRWNKVNFWDRMLEFATENRDRKALIAGDCNSGLLEDGEGEPMQLREKMEALLSLGWIDCWRALNGKERTEYTWYSPNKGNGFRLDHCFISPTAASKLRAARFSHTERTERLSDHSVLIVDLDL